MSTNDDVTMLSFGNNLRYVPAFSKLRLCCYQKDIKRLRDLLFGPPCRFLVASGAWYVISYPDFSSHRNTDSHAGSKNYVVIYRHYYRSARVNVPNYWFDQLCVSSWLQ